MALHEVADAQAEALITLLSGALNAELSALAGEDVVRATYAWPAITNERVPQLGHPALAVWREEDVYVERTMQRPEHEVTWRIDYVLPATALELASGRWQLLGRVWEKTVGLIEAGKHPSVNGGAHILRDAGFVEIIIGQRFPRASFVEIQGPRGVYPAFQGRVRLRHREDPDTSDLPALSLETRVFPHELPADERATFAAQLHDALNAATQGIDAEFGDDDE